MKFLVHLTLLVSVLLVFGVGCQQDTGSSLADLPSRDPIIADWRYMMKYGEVITKANVRDMLAVDQNEEKRWDCELRSAVDAASELNEGYDSINGKKFSEYYQIKLDPNRIWNYRKSAEQETYELTSPNYTWTELGLQRIIRKKRQGQGHYNLTTYLRRYEDKLIKESSGTHDEGFGRMWYGELLEPIIGGFSGSTNETYNGDQERTTTLSYTLCQLVDREVETPEVETPDVDDKVIPDSNFKFVELSSVNDTGFPARFEMGVRQPKHRVFIGKVDPIHWVTLTRPFAVQKTEVTQKQWFEIMGTNPSKFASEDVCGDDYDPSRDICPEHPVETVSWPSVQEFIKKLNSKTNLDCGDTATKDGFLLASKTPGCYRLPTEAEWEYFTRAGTTTPYNINLRRGGTHISSDDQVNYDGRYTLEHRWIEARREYIGFRPYARHRKTTVAGGSLDNENMWGLYDTHGNVYEWVQDYFDEDFYRSSREEDPASLSNGSYRVMRGGAWDSAGRECTSHYRGLGRPDIEEERVGFRLVRTTVQ